MTDLMPFDDPRRPVSTVADLETLDPDEMQEGFKDGYEGFPCSGNRSRSYWHGWQNGMVDMHRLPMRPEMRMLAKELVAKWKRDGFK